MVKIVIDSGCDLSETMLARITAAQVISVPLVLTVDGQDYIDDDTLDVVEYLRITEQSPTGPTTAAPSPQSFLEAFAGEDSVFVVTLSSKLSASFESASLAARMRAEQFKDSLTHIFDSLSASVGEALVALKISELLDQQIAEREIIGRVENFISNMSTYFILDNFDTAVRTGRMHKTVATMAEFLHIKPICAGVDGEMKVIGKARNYSRALAQLVKMIKAQAVDFSERILAVSHVQSASKAEETVAYIMAEIPFKDCMITATRGLSSTYAARGGIILTF